MKGSGLEFPTPPATPASPNQGRGTRGIIEAVIASASGYGLVLASASPTFGVQVPGVSSQATLVGLGVVILIHWLVALRINLRVYVAVCAVFAFGLTLPAFRQQDGGLALTDLTMRFAAGQEVTLPGPVYFLGLWFTFLCPPLMAVCVMVMMRQRRAAQVGEDRA